MHEHKTSIQSDLKISIFLTIIFYYQAIRRTIDKKTVDVFQMFNEELNAVKKELTQKTVPLPQAHPKFAGQAHWARMLKKEDRTFYDGKCYLYIKTYYKTNDILYKILSHLI